MGEEAHLFLRARDRRLHYSGQVGFCPLIDMVGSSVWVVIVLCRNKVAALLD